MSKVDDLFELYEDEHRCFDDIKDKRSWWYALTNERRMFTYGMTHEEGLSQR